MDDDTFPYGLAQGCAVCASKTRLLHCSGCKVVSYCGTAHRSAHRAKHNAACNAIRESRETLEHEEAALRAHPGDPFLMPADVFNNGVGRFWGLFGTRDYMRARFAAASALLEVDTVLAIEKALEHFTDMLRLCRSDNLGVRDIVPDLLLRLGREQECYDFIKWWDTIDDKDHYDGHYDWGDVTLPYLDLRGADPFEPDGFWSKDSSLSHLVSLTLLKLRLQLDLRAYEDESEFGWDPLRTEPIRPVGKLVREKLRFLGRDGFLSTVKEVERQCHQLCSMVNDANPYFWEGLVDELEETPTVPPYYSFGSKEEADLVLHRCKRAWQESEDAVLMIDSYTSTFTRVYQGPAIVAGDTRPRRPELRAEDVEKRRATGDAVFPSLYQPVPPTSRPTELFLPFITPRGETDRFVCRNDRKKVLVYVDGACANNGQAEPRAGWAVVGGPSEVVSGPLEDRGPCGDVSVATSNRAELRAAIAALRLCDWRGEGLESIVIATDSSYVVDGATGWVKGWVRNGWKTSKGTGVKNKDLWDLLLGEVEQWKGRGLRVELWKIPRELNVEADTAAKNAACEVAAGVGLSGVVADAPRGTPRILALCLEYEQMFVEVHGSLVSHLTSEANMERVTTQEAALNILSQEPPPSVILVADGAIARRRKLWERVIDRLREGATVVLAGCFSSMVTEGEFKRVFATLGLPWQRGSYQRTTVRLRRDVVGDHLASQLPSSYSQKALFVKNVERSAAWYTLSETSDEAAVVFAKVGLGRLGYVGDVNGEESSDTVVLAMCGLLN